MSRRNLITLSSVLFMFYPSSLVIMSTPIKSLPGSPSTGWRWLRATDLQNDDDQRASSSNTERSICQFCGREKIRFVHHLAHEDWPGTIAVGRICANDLAGDPAIDATERRLRNLAQRRAAFTKLKGWQTSEKGNLWIEYEGHHIVVVRFPGGRCRLRIDGEFGRLTFANKDRAMRRAFDVVQRKLARED